MMKDNASTDVIVHRGEALASFYQCGELYRLDPHTLETKGTTEWGGFFRGRASRSSARRTHRRTALLQLRDRGAVHALRGREPGRRTRHLHRRALAGPRLPHDMMFTENWTILNDLPLFWDPEALTSGYYSNVFRRDLPSRFALVPRHGSTEDIRWFEADRPSSSTGPTPTRTVTRSSSTASSSTTPRLEALTAVRTSTRSTRGSRPST